MPRCLQERCGEEQPQNVMETENQLSDRKVELLAQHFKCEQVLRGRREKRLRFLNKNKLSWRAVTLQTCEQ